MTRRADIGALGTETNQFVPLEVTVICGRQVASR